MRTTGMKWHYIYNSLLALASSVLILYLTFENIFDYFNDEWFYLLGGAVLGISLINLIKINKIAYILTVVLNSLLNIACFIATVVSFLMIIYGLYYADSWDQLAAAFGAYSAIVCVPILMLTIINFIYYKKRKFLFW